MDMEHALPILFRPEARLVIFLNFCYEDEVPAECSAIVCSIAQGLREKLASDAAQLLQAVENKEFGG